MARPKLDIDPREVEKLAEFGCTNREIASFFDCSTDTIERRFAAEIAKGKDKGYIKLRKLQWAAAEKGNAVILIFLGKQYLGQRDSFTHEESVQAVQPSIYKIHDGNKLKSEAS